MFSIAAINDGETAQQEWQPLAPTKEAQEFRLTQLYQESLLHMQAGEYKQAQSLLQTIIEDPLSANAEADNVASTDPMRQLRFLSFRNLAEAYFKQGPHVHKDALQCFLRAVSIDGKDVTLWNRLGTLACMLGSYNIARWAFEQGLQCSPDHWACMEKLVEVFIAIGDEAACLYVVKRLLRISPSHSRALLIKRVIEENVDPPNVLKNLEKPYKYSKMLRGIDKLKPQHHNLSFTKNVNHDELTIPQKTVLEGAVINLEEASWSELLTNVWTSIERLNGKCANDVQGANTTSSDTPLVSVTASVTFLLKGKNINEFENQDTRMDCDDMGNETTYLPHGGKESSTPGKPSKLEVTPGIDPGSDRTVTLKERDVYTDEEPPLERRSTRLERIRTRKFDRSEEPDNMQLDEGKNRMSFEGLKKLFEPYIVCKVHLDNNVPALVSSASEQGKTQVVDYVEEREVLNFLKIHTVNSGLYHIAQKLLQKISLSSIKRLDNWTTLARLEKCIRNTTRESNLLSSLFLAEVYMDMLSSATGDHETIKLLEDCDYQLCSILGHIAAAKPDTFNVFEVSVPEDIEYSDTKMSENVELLGDINEICWWAFWVRFYWVSGRAHYFKGNSQRGRNDFQKCLDILEAQAQKQSQIVTVDLPHCRAEKQISAELVRHKIYEVQMQDLLSHSAAQMLQENRYTDLIKLLGPAVFNGGDKETQLVAGKKNASNFSTEMKALDMLISACIRSEPKNTNMALQCYVRRMHIHLLTAGITNSMRDVMQGQVETINGEWFMLAVKEVKQVSRFLAEIDERVPDKSNLILDEKLLGQMQQLLLTLMCHVSMSPAFRRPSGLPMVNLDSTEQPEVSCFVDAAVAFCRLQHFYQAASIKEQVDLLVGVHDVLAEYGLCCAGKDCEGGEGVFLKMAIKRFLHLEMQLKAEFPSGRKLMFDDTLDKSNDDEDQPMSVVSVALDDKSNESSTREKTEGSKESHPEKKRKIIVSSSCDDQKLDLEKRKTDLGLDMALDQSFFCLYGLNLSGGLESIGSQDGLTAHANTSIGEYQTKEQCAEVFQYLLPYARVCTKTCLPKLRKVLRAIRNHFQDPPNNVLQSNPINAYLDATDLDETLLSNMVVNNASTNEVLGYVLRTVSLIETPNGSEGLKGGLDTSDMDSEDSKGVKGQPDYVDNFNMKIKSGPYQEVYENLYYLLTQVEETCASDKWPGFVFTKEGEDFVEQNSKLFKYDLLYNITRFESWQNLANIYDEEVDLMLNDGSKTTSAMEWHKNAQLIKRVECGRQRTRRCLFMSLALATTPEEESQVHEHLALLYYDSIQNVAPSYNQRQNTVVRDKTWREICQKAVMHFKKALSFKTEWTYLFYLGKLCEKLGEPCEKALDYYAKAAAINPSAVDPLYRLHSSRLKWLCSKGFDDSDTLKAIAKHCYIEGTKDQVYSLVEEHKQLDSLSLSIEERKKKSWDFLFDDCVKALEACTEGELKHYHKARFRLAQGFFLRNRENDIEKAKEELSFCFKSNRSPFTINMWEIDGSTKKNKRKTPGTTSARRGFEILMPETSRKFITCLRKYLQFYLKLCEKTFDLCTLERAYCSLKVDKKFCLCLADMINVALGKYIHTLAAAIHQLDIGGVVFNHSLVSLTERFFNLFMEHGGSLSDVVMSTFTEAGFSVVEVPSENAIYSYIHRYIHILECDNKVDVLELINEKIKKRFKTVKPGKELCSQVLKHAAIAWCRALCVSLAVITPTHLGNEGSVPCSQDQLVVEVQDNEFWNSAAELYETVGGTKRWYNFLNMSRIRVKQANPENMDQATNLLRQSFTFYRDCAGPFPSGIKLFLIQSASNSDISNAVMISNSSMVGMDLSVPRKLLLWAYTLVHGHTCSIAEAVRFCEEQAKNKIKKVLPHASPTVNIQGEKSAGSGSKETTGSVCTQLHNDNTVNDKDKIMLEENETSGRVSCPMQTPSDGGQCQVPYTIQSQSTSVDNLPKSEEKPMPSDPER